MYVPQMAIIQINLCKYQHSMDDKDTVELDVVQGVCGHYHGH